MNRSLAACVALGVLGVARAALATTTEPNGVQVPLDSNNGETQLYTLFQGRSDPVDWQADAHTTPATFSPLCNFRATFVLHEAGADRGVGWYNVDPAATTAPTDIHVVVPAGTPVGTSIDSTTIKGDPAYAGGLVGFALVDGQTHYSEQQWNPACILCATPGPWVLSVTYQSKSVPNAYYLAFEDGNVDGFTFGNDGDFNDDVFFFEGLTCEGGGTPCSTGQLGLCAEGLNECGPTGLTCKPLVRPAPEKCDGIDNDCNGLTDDGDLCDPNFVCDHGTCVARCGSGEFECTDGLVCNAGGFCVDPACATVTCAAGTVCVGGTCKAPCDGIVCPMPSVCRVGRCADPCQGVECAVGTVCDRGVCLPDCDCNPCPTGLACDAASQRCVEPPCAGKACAPGQACAGGNCIDPCAGAVCPAGQACEFGVCVTRAQPDAGAAGGSGGAPPIIVIPDTGGAPGVGTGGTSSVDAGTGPGFGTGGTGAPAGEPLGCGCRTAAGRNTLPPVALGALALGLLVRVRRRARRS